MEKPIDAIKSNTFMRISFSLISNITGKNRKIIAIADKIKENFWCLNISFFNINLEKRGTKNKKYILLSNTLLKAYDSQTVNEAKQTESANKSINILQLFFFRPSLYIYCMLEVLFLYTMALFLVCSVFVLIEEIKYNRPPEK